MSIDINKNTPATNKQPISYINKLMLEKNYRMLLLERDTIKNILYNLKLELKRAQDGKNLEKIKRISKSYKHAEAQIRFIEKFIDMDKYAPVLIKYKARVTSQLQGH